MTSPNIITADILALGAQIPGITAVGDELPAALTDNHLPFLLVVEGGADWNTLDAFTLTVIRDWTLLLWVQAYMQGSAPSEKAARDACLPFMRAVPLFFWQRRQLDESAVVDAQLIRDEGAQSLSHGERRYYGVPFRLRVHYLEDM